MNKRELIINAIKKSKFNPMGRMIIYSDLWDCALLREAESFGYLCRKFYKHLCGQEVYNLTAKGLDLV